MRQTVEPHLSSAAFYRHDPLLTLIRDRLHLGIGWSAIGIALLTYVALFSAPRLAGIPAQLDDVTGWLQSFVIHPAAVAIYLALPDTLAGLFGSLKENGVIGQTRRQGGVS